MPLSPAFSKVSFEDLSRPIRDLLETFPSGDSGLETRGRSDRYNTSNVDTVGLVSDTSGGSHPGMHLPNV